MKKLKKAIFLIFLLLPSYTLAVWYVDADVKSSGNGTSWFNAFKSIQEAVDAAVSDDEIWVKKGQYKLFKEINIDKTIGLYGGFSGSETDKNQRNWTVNVTTVDGQRNVRGFNITADATIDGFQIVNGKDFRQGGGMKIVNSAPTIRNSIFENNNVDFNGGAIYTSSATPRIINTMFVENRASNGGGIYNHDNSYPQLTNCIFYKNYASEGAAIYNNFSASPTITNCTFTKNSSKGGATYNNINSSPIITNSILWDNKNEIHNQDNTSVPIVSYSNVEGGYIGDGNIDEDPLFVNAPDNDLHLRVNSPAIDSGTYTNAPSIDLDNNPRPADSGYDMGAYEFYKDGIIRFATTNYLVNEDAESIELIASRSGGSIGDVEITYTTIEGTAKEASDYQAKANILRWGDGDRESKSLSIKIIDNDDNDGDKSFKVSLSNYRGKAILGEPNEATITIMDNDPPTPCLRVDSTSGSVPLTVNLDASCSTGNPSKTLEYNWSCDGNKPCPDMSSTSSEIDVEFTRCGVYTITLTVNDGRYSAQKKETINVNCIPKAKFSYQLMFGDLLKVDASQSTDEDGNITEYEWYVDGTRQSETGKITTLSIQKTAIVNRIIKLKVTDEKGEINEISHDVKIYGAYNNTARVQPQIIAAGASPSTVDLNEDDRFDFLALIRPGVEPIETVSFKDANTSSESSDNVFNVSKVGLKMTLAGILANGDEIYKASYSYDKTIGHKTVSTTWGPHPGQFNITAVDHFSNSSHAFPYLMVGNFPQQPDIYRRSGDDQLIYNNTARFGPQVIMAGYTPAQLDVGDTEFDVIAIIRPGKLPIKRVAAKQNQGDWSHMMDFIGDLDNGDKVYKLTFIYPRGAFGEPGKNEIFSYKEIFGPNAIQFGIEAVDENEQGSHKFPDIKFGNYPEYIK